jgi:hypothetical protein
MLQVIQKAVAAGHGLLLALCCPCDFGNWNKHIVAVHAEIVYAR